ncbi:hypothetical protein ACFU76_14860 [Streptomyces sp. NPDC057539]|uniref:hypothetical protein n=1 Tax=Streptomyces sp. NPDC057539 TaxID=3346159 RepID=UPI0036C6B095
MTVPFRLVSGLQTGLSGLSENLRRTWRTEGDCAGDWISLTWGFVFGLCAMVIAFDYRNVGLRFYDLVASLPPGGGVDPRFSPDVMRCISGLLGVISLTSTGIEAYGML